VREFTVTFCLFFGEEDRRKEMGGVKGQVMGTIKSTTPFSKAVTA